jgi:hypothetical protein
MAGGVAAGGAACAGAAGAGAGVCATAGTIATVAAARVRQKARFMGGEPECLEGEIRIDGNTPGVNVRAAASSCDVITPKTWFSAI